MKKTLKILIQNNLVHKLSELKRKYFPNKKQREKKLQEIIEIHKRENFYATFINKNDLCFDVGANVGNRIQALLAVGARVVAIEPQKSCYKILKKKFGNKIEIVTKGLGENDSIKQFYLSNSSTISSFSKEWIDSVKDNRFKGYNWNKTIKVEMTTLDKLIRQYGQPTFIKIDVEGYELEVLKGLSKPVNMISFEYTVPEQTNKAIACIDQIEKVISKIECNYSIGESMTFALNNWLSTEEIKSLITEEEFLKTGFGDIYVRIKNND